MRLAACLASVALFLSGAAVLPAGPPSDKATRLALTGDEALLVACVNAERAAKGLRPLTVDPVLVEVARGHSADMAKRGYFGHIGPAPAKATPVDRYAAALGRPPGTVVGENLACCDQPLMGRIHEGMMASPQHRANILDRQYVSFGVGIHVLDDGRVWVTQMFRGGVPPAPPRGTT